MLIISIFNSCNNGMPSLTTIDQIIRAKEIIAHKYHLANNGSL